MHNEEYYRENKDSIVSDIIDELQSKEVMLDLKLSEDKVNKIIYDFCYKCDILDFEEDIQSAVYNNYYN